MTKASAPIRPAAVACAFLAFLAASPSVAQTGEENPDSRRGWLVTIGGGAQVTPKYPGSDEIGFIPMPIVGLRREGTPLPLEAPDEGWGFGLLGSDSPFNLGPAVQFVNKREEEDVGAPVGEVDFTVEVGGFVELFPMRNFRLRAEGRKGLGGHDGLIGDIGADFVIRDRDTYVFSIGPRVRIANGEYHRAYYGVTPAVAAATGLPIFDPDGGVYALGAVAGLNYMLSEQWGLYTYAGYDRLTGDAADSPITRAFGSRNQYSAGLGLSYTFSVGRPARR